MSLGVAMLDRTRQAGAAATAMVAAADAAMYRAKNAGRDRVYASPEQPYPG
jgi:PleD family two-component response regulator